MSKNTPSVNILGVNITSKTMNEITNDLSSLAGKYQKIQIITANPEIILLANKNKEYKSIVDKSYLVTPDGIGVIIASKIFKQPLVERVAGIDLLMSLLEIANKNKWKIYFLGTTEERVSKATENIKEKYPNIEIKYHNGFFDSNEEQKIIKDINDFQPHLLLTGLGAPKQDIWIDKHKDNLSFSIAFGVGGTFDILSGELKRAPIFFQRFGLEWLYRLIQEPTRFKRMLNIPVFLCKVIISKFKRNP